MLLVESKSIYFITNGRIKNNFKQCIELMRVVIKSQGLLFLYVFYSFKVINSSIEITVEDFDRYFIR